MIRVRRIVGVAELETFLNSIKMKHLKYLFEVATNSTTIEFCVVWDDK